jgi:hypothetical protein
LKSEKRKAQKMTTRRYNSRGVEVEIQEAKDEVVLKLDGIPIEVEIVDGEYHSQTANMFAGFASIDVLVDSLLEHEGLTWTLHGSPRLKGSQGSHSHEGHGRGGQEGEHSHGDHTHDQEGKQ